jgi:UPF0755 protein
VIRRLLIAFLLLALLVAAAGVLLTREVQRQWQQPLAISGEDYRLNIKAGDSLRGVADRLVADGILPHPWLLRAYGRWTGLDQSIKRGEYRVPAGTTQEQLLLLLNSGKVIQYQVTLPEGITLARALELLAAEADLEHVLGGIEDERITALVAPAKVAEGLFFPDTYQYELGATDWQVLQRAHRAMRQVLEQEWSGRAEGLPYSDPYEALIMASIVERETGLASERQQIAGVFVRRLRKNMRLQTDPTVIYGLGSEFDGNLRRKHLRDDSNPYNTYRHAGLPPSPIALPGRAAVHAALHPADGETLYFVARGDGGHVFSKTLAEHEQAVRKYQLQRRKDYRSSPGN